MGVIALVFQIQLLKHLHRLHSHQLMRIFELRNHHFVAVLQEQVRIALRHDLEAHAPIGVVEFRKALVRRKPIVLLRRPLLAHGSARAGHGHDGLRSENDGAAQVSVQLLIDTFDKHIKKFEYTPVLKEALLPN